MLCVPTFVDFPENLTFGKNGFLNLELGIVLQFMLKFGLTFSMETRDFMKTHVVVCVVEFRGVKGEYVRGNSQSPDEQFRKTKGQTFEKACVQHAAINGAKGEKLQNERQ
jgi:hypothetical protein